MMIIYTDGGTRYLRHNGSSTLLSTDLCAYAYRIDDTAKHHYLAGAQAMTGCTNNQMEGTALNMALFRLENVVLKATHMNVAKDFKLRMPFEVVADSKYVISQASDLAHLKWRLANKKNMPNKDIWRAYLKHRQHFPNLTFHWCKGHAHTDGNIYVDHLLNHMMDDEKAGKRHYIEIAK